MNGGGGGARGEVDVQAARVAFVWGNPNGPIDDVPLIRSRDREITDAISVVRLENMARSLLLVM